MARRHTHPKRLCGATTRSGGKCRRWVVPGKTRCRLHGGLSTGPKRRFWETEQQRVERIAAAVANMIAGRRRWLAILKRRGEKAPCGRKPKGWLPSIHELDAKAWRADRKRIEGPFRQHMRECEAEEQWREREAQKQSELERIAKENRMRADPNMRLPGETPQERATRIACIGERRQRELAAALRERVEAKLRINGFFL